MSMRYGWQWIVNHIDPSRVAFNALRIVLIVVIAWTALKVAQFFVGRFEQYVMKRLESRGDSAEESKKRAGTLTGLVRQSLSVLFWFVVILTLLMQLGVNVGPILASAGIFGVALGFGSQSLVRDVVSGFFILLENQVRVNDVATINGTGGVVEAIHFRTTVLRDAAGTVHVFRNGAINEIANLTRDWGGYVFELGVGYHEDTDRVIEVITDIGLELKKDQVFGADVIADLEVFGVDKLADSAVLIKGRIKTKPGRQWAIGREFLSRVKKRFDKENIEIPFPQRTVTVVQTETEA